MPKFGVSQTFGSTIISCVTSLSFFICTKDDDSHLTPSVVEGGSKVLCILLSPSESWLSAL